MSHGSGILLWLWSQGMSARCECQLPVLEVFVTNHVTLLNTQPLSLLTYLPNAKLLAMNYQTVLHRD